MTDRQRQSSRTGRCLFPAPSSVLAPPPSRRASLHRPRCSGTVPCPSGPGAAAAPPSAACRPPAGCEPGTRAAPRPPCGLVAKAPAAPALTAPPAGPPPRRPPPCHRAAPEAALRGCRGGRGAPAGGGASRAAGRTLVPQPAFPAHLRHIGTIGLRNSAAPSARMGPLSQWQPPSPSRRRPGRERRGRRDRAAE